MAIDKKKVGKRLEALRGKRTQREIAELIGVTPAAISQYENGERMPADDIKIKLSVLYKRSVATIFFAD